ncbi:hypothetical protein K491DRAFT_637145 [Lophiostoma macrostomum CBS 122681]|uniref:Saccharopine dehydrogenase NADP binding domain-containing protein n=1 Tax=Lophiostoma macrostomum CBS 122681 TaxID=1314788 RepID=A0A6A6SVH0_9PLEO|nr:hypothetical protein K491DRAFT_637145 [Lophiostoma macrostomum CBS 122681]
MSSTERQYELVLLGATGYTGKLVAEWITTHLPGDINWAVAGRNTNKLQKVVSELKELNPNRQQPAIETVEQKKDQLDTLARKTRLLITTVGPFLLHGEPVLAACAENGTHYLDSTGEIPWYYDMVAKYDAVAKRNGAIIIPQCGMDSVPSDIMSFVISRHIRETYNAGTLSAILTLYSVKAGISGGTASTAIEIFSNYSLKHLGTSMKPYSISPVRPTNPSPRPTSSLFYRLLGLVNVPELGGAQTVGLMASVDACLVHRSWGLYEDIAKTRSQPELAYGTRFRFTEYMRAKSLIFGALFKLGYAFAGLLLAFPPSRWVLAPFLKRFVIPAPGEGPSKEEMKNEFLHYRILGTADTEKKEKALAKWYCAYGGYGLTGLTLAAAADLFLRGDIDATEAGKSGGGILTPATLGEPFVEKLKAFGVKIEVPA